MVLALWDALKLNVAELVVTPKGVTAAVPASARQNGAEAYAVANVKAQLVTPPDQVTEPTLSVDFTFMTGVVPHVPTVGTVPLETMCPIT